MKRGAKKQPITPLVAPEAFRVDAEERPQDAEMETPALRSLGLAHYWLHLLDIGAVLSLKEIAAAEGVDLGQINRIARLALVAPWVRGGQQAKLPSAGQQR